MSSAPVVTRCGQIAVVGRPNVGKSTLLNRLVGEKISITSRKAQTTRLPIRGVLTRGDAQFIFVDTPGYQTRHGGELNRRLNASVRRVLDEVDVVLWVWEAPRLTPGDRAVLELLPQNKPIVVVPNKIDQLRGDEARATLAETVRELAQEVRFVAFVPVSATEGTQIDALLEELRQRLPPGEALYEPDTLTDRSERVLAAELIREKVFRLTGDEIPYRTAVLIDRFEQRGALRRICATILVDKPSQRPLLIGAGGERLKRIGTEARLDMERLFGGRVYLELFVKVKTGWSDNLTVLRELGLA
ncbi:MAG: GTPase Era [Casimicrobiaceae bacterium]|nr:GTPase Era [Casimicrobiaceae bacterium]MCX8099094.1 GTPase Era [Casimicrobiaceae bacterium]MDW8312370.1 GTPase Era [Burkholderiales bacterium]